MSNVATVDEEIFTDGDAERVIVKSFVGGDGTRRVEDLSPAEYLEMARKWPVEESRDPKTSLRDSCVDGKGRSFSDFRWIDFGKQQSQPDGLTDRQRTCFALAFKNIDREFRSVCGRDDGTCRKRIDPTPQAARKIGAVVRCQGCSRLVGKIEIAW